jgi:hypothetical protein
MGRHVNQRASQHERGLFKRDRIETEDSHSTII